VENTAEIRYAGVVVGRTSEVRDLDAGGAFVSLAEPLPVGTLLSVKIGDDARDAHVTEVIESADAAVAGMRIRFAADGVPQEVEGAPSGSSSEGGSQAVPADGGGRRRRKRR
jgi:hypothetical protein